MRTLELPAHSAVSAVDPLPCVHRNRISFLPFPAGRERAP